MCSRSKVYSPGCSAYGLRREEYAAKIPCRAYSNHVRCSGMDVLIRNSSAAFLGEVSEIFLFLVEVGFGESVLSGVIALLLLYEYIVSLKFCPANLPSDCNAVQYRRRRVF